MCSSADIRTSVRAVMWKSQDCEGGGGAKEITAGVRECVCVCVLAADS